MSASPGCVPTDSSSITSSEEGVWSAPAEPNQSVGSAESTLPLVSDSPVTESIEETVESSEDVLTAIPADDTCHGTTEASE